MIDLLYLSLTLGFFALMLGYVEACRRQGGRSAEKRYERCMDDRGRHLAGKTCLSGRHPATPGAILI
jgi:hypothetical protein